MTVATEEHAERKLLEVDPNKFAELSDSRQRVNEALVKFNASNEDMKAKKKIYEAARSAFERDFDRFVANVRGEDLPLFSQSELLDKAKNDPVVAKLVDGLLQLGHDVNAIIVSGYTQDERHLVEQYLEAEANRKALIESDATDVPDVEVPAFLTPQPPTAIELASLAERIIDADDTLSVSTDQLAAFSNAQRAEVTEWLERCAAVKQDKGDDVTVEDLPAPPEFLHDAADKNAPAED